MVLRSIDPSNPGLVHHVVCNQDFMSAFAVDAAVKAVMEVAVGDADPISIDADISNLMTDRGKMCNYSKSLLHAALIVKIKTWQEPAVLVRHLAVKTCKRLIRHLFDVSCCQKYQEGYECPPLGLALFAIYDAQAA